MQDFMMGYSETDITPDDPVELVGFNRKDNTLQGIRDSLYAQVSIWKLGDELYCLADIDNIGSVKRYADELRDRIGQVISIQREKVMLCFSHTHAAPNVDIEEVYRQNLYEKVCHCAKAAMNTMSSVHAAWGNGQGNIGFNRRKGCDAMDRRIGILKVTDAQSGKVKLLLLRLTAHANVLKRDNYMVSSDYFGAVRNLLGQKYHCPVIVTQGASGNVAPRYVCTDLILPDACDEQVIRTPVALEKMAEEVCLQVQKVFDDIYTHPIHKMNMFSREKDFFVDVPDYNRALEIAEEAQREAGIDGEMWLMEVQRLLNEQVTEQTDTTEIQFFSLDEGCLCGLANEIMCEFALKAWEKTGNEYFYLGGYTNGCTGYFPTEEEFDEGGYEIYWSMLLYYRYHGRVFPLRRNSAAELINFVVENAG